MMIFWGDDIVETTKGVDILGVRGTDQTVELGLVNGITTISQRARYLSILTWSIGEFLVDQANVGFDWDRFLIYLRRVEFVTLAASRLDSDRNGTDATGALGARLHYDRIHRLLGGESVSCPTKQGGAILGTYLGPCRAMGLLVDGDDTVPYRLTPRGKEMWETRRTCLKSCPIMAAISSGQEVSLALVESAIPHFSLDALASSGQEASVLRKALMQPWEPSSEPARVRVAKAYEGINRTRVWAEKMLAKTPDSATGLLVRNFRNCIDGSAKTGIEHTWAEYEYRRRCHFALELLLAALTASLREFEKASIAQIVARWFSPFTTAPFLRKVWPRVSEAMESSAARAVASVPEQLFVGARIPMSDFRNLPPSNQALGALAILAAVAAQTRVIRRDGHLDHHPGSPGERALENIESAAEEPFSEFVRKLVELTALVHLQNTLRKMGAGQKCSLRFFPDGAFMRSTGIGVSPGQSGDRLTNVLRILTDIGEFRRDGGKYALSDSGQQ